MEDHNAFIPEPCPADWDQMSGDERKRYCSQCEKQVHHLSSVSRREAEAVLAEAESAKAAGDTGALCVRFGICADGSTYHPPVERYGDAPLEQRRGVQRLLLTAAAVFALLPGGLAMHELFAQENGEEFDHLMVGELQAEPEMQGDVEFVAPCPSSTEGEEEEGDGEPEESEAEEGEQNVDTSVLHHQEIVRPRVTPAIAGGIGRPPASQQQKSPRARVLEQERKEHARLAEFGIELEEEVIRPREPLAYF